MFKLRIIYFILSMMRLSMNEVINSLKGNRKKYNNASFVLSFLFFHGLIPGVLISKLFFVEGRFYTRFSPPTEISKETHFQMHFMQNCPGHFCLFCFQ